MPRADDLPRRAAPTRCKWASRRCWRSARACRWSRISARAILRRGDRARRWCRSSITCCSATPKRTRIALNIGGIANITVIPPGAAPEEVIAFDTGPGNMVIDALAREFSKGTLSCDRGGRIAESGQVNGKLLDELLKDPYYRRKPPKSAGREQYGAEFVARLTRTGLPAADLIATATVLTAATIAMGIGRNTRRPDCFGRRRAQSANHGAPRGIFAGDGDLHLDRPRDRCRCQRGNCIRGAGGTDVARTAGKSAFGDGGAAGGGVGKHHAVKKVGSGRQRASASRP